MASIFERFAKSVIAAPEEAYVVWTSKEAADKNSASYDAGQIILTSWCEWLDANSERNAADTLRFLNRGAAKGITLPATDPNYWNRVSATHAYPARQAKKSWGRGKAYSDGEDPF